MTRWDQQSATYCKKAVSYSATEIIKLVPHRFPFIFLDKVYYYQNPLILDQHFCFGQKQVSANQRMIMTQTLCLDALAQLAYCFYQLTRLKPLLPNSQQIPGAFIGLNNTVLGAAPLPGQTLNFSVKLDRVLIPYYLFRACAFSDQLVIKTQLVFMLS